MKKGLLALMLLLSTIIYADDYKLTIAMKLDQYILMAKKAIAQSDYNNSLKYLKKIEALKLEKNENDFYYLYGKTAYELNDFLNAKAKMHTYLKHTKRAGDYYLESLEIIAKSEEKLSAKENYKKKMQSKKLSYVNGGSFVMGSQKTYDEKPTHNVTLTSYFIGQYEITNKEYIDFLNAKNIDKTGTSNGRKLIDLRDRDCAINYIDGKFHFRENKIAKSDDTPVVEVTWWGAVAYCNWLSEKEGLAPAYCMETGEFLDRTGNAEKDIIKVEGYRLPTEAEWEYAARGGENHETLYSGSNNIDEVAWYGDVKQLNPIGKKKANKLGLYDMSGNVWEWCTDWYIEEAYANHSAKNPYTSKKSGLKSRRGGAWVNMKEYCRVANRFKHRPDNSGRALGFRIAKTGY